MKKFFIDLLHMSPVEHLVNYWIIWLLYVGGCFIILYALNKKKSD